MEKAATGHRVTVHLSGTIDDGRIFESTRDGEPVQFTIGQGEVLPGIEQAIIGMVPGEQKRVTLPPELAFGEHNSELVFREPRSSMPEELELVEGMELMVKSPEDVSVLLRVVSLDEDTVVLDANHPLADRTLQLEIELVEMSA